MCMSVGPFNGYANAVRTKYEYFQFNYHFAQNLAGIIGKKTPVDVCSNLQDIMSVESLQPKRKCQSTRVSSVIYNAL